MTKLYRSLAVCTVAVAFAMLSIAAAQQYTTIDFPGAIATDIAGGPNPQGTSVGFQQDTSGVLHGFTLTKQGVFTSFDPPGSTFTVAFFIDPQGVIVGEYFDSSFVSHGFILDGGKYTSVNVPGAAGTGLGGINPSGEISGFTCSDPACGLTGFPNMNHSFVESKNGVFTIFDPPGATSSIAGTGNPSGAVVGGYTNNGGSTCITECQGYLLEHGTFTTINFPQSTFTSLSGVNAPGDIVGAYVDAAGVFHSFLLSKGVYESFDPPGAAFSLASGINPGGIIGGVYVDSAGVEHGYIRMP